MGRGNPLKGWGLEDLRSNYKGPDATSDVKDVCNVACIADTLVVNDLQV